MEKVDKELALLPQYDYMVENDNLQKAIELIRCIIKVERARIHNEKSKGG
jgi:guanylate kinase